MRCKCESKSKEVKQIGSWDHCPLEGSGHTSFIVFRCSKCGGIDGFPSENLDIALKEGTPETKKKLDEIINDSKEQPLTEEKRWISVGRLLDFQTGKRQLIFYANTGDLIWRIGVIINE